MVLTAGWSDAQTRTHIGGGGSLERFMIPGRAGGSPVDWLRLAFIALSILTKKDGCMLGARAIAAGASDQGSTRSGNNGYELSCSYLSSRSQALPGTALPRGSASPPPRPERCVDPRPL